MRRLSLTATLFAAAALALFSLATWDTAFNTPYRSRLAALDAIPSGPFLAIDAAAWRWISDRAVLVTPSDGPDSTTACVASLYGAQSVVLEPAHFSKYDALYNGGSVPWLGPPIDRDGIRIYPFLRNIFCAVQR